MGSTAGDVGSGFWAGGSASTGVGTDSNGVGVGSGMKGGGIRGSGSMAGGSGSLDVGTMTSTGRYRIIGPGTYPNWLATVGLFPESFPAITKDRSLVGHHGRNGF